VEEKSIPPITGKERGERKNDDTQDSGSGTSAKAHWSEQERMQASERGRKTPQGERDFRNPLSAKKVLEKATKRRTCGGRLTTTKLEKALQHRHCPIRASERNLGKQERNSRNSRFDGGNVFDEGDDQNRHTNQPQGIKVKGKRAFSGGKDRKKTKTTPLPTGGLNPFTLPYHSSRELCRDHTIV